MQVWLKHDLRLDDHPGFVQAYEQGSPVVPAFCMDPRLYVHLQRTPNGIPGKQFSIVQLQCCELARSILVPCAFPMFLLIEEAILTSISMLYAKEHSTG